MSAPAPPASTESPIEVEAPAKLNLGLRVVGRRPDGYHLLESVFVPLDLADTLSVEVGPGDGVSLMLEGGASADAPGAESVPTDDRNLAVRAARAFLEEARCEASVTLRLTKRVPAAAGLGGGSSDAGAVLRALARRWPDALDPNALERVALALGADVPFFLDPRPSLVSGVGEHRRALDRVPALPLVLANPRRALSTAAVFAGRAEGGRAFSPEGNAGTALRALDAAGWLEPGAASAWASLLENDLAEAAEALCPAMRGLRSALEGAGALASGQSGSGATVFGVFGSLADAERAEKALSASDSAWFRVAVSVAAG